MLAIFCHRLRAPRKPLHHLFKNLYPWNKCVEQIQQLTASDRLYFEELTVERILDIAEFESPHGVITCVGGQTANNLTPELAENKIPILGTAAVDVDRAENRSTFSSVLDSMHIRQPPWQTFADITSAKEFAHRVRYLGA